MLTVNSETLIPVAKVPAMIPTRPNVATVYRWITRGSNGRKLEAVRIGKALFTTEEALRRFATTINAAHRKAKNERCDCRARERAAAKSRLEALGV